MDKEASQRQLEDELEEKLEPASDDWESERTKLILQINRLEAALTDALERASNPLRMVQSVKGEFEGQLNRIAQEKTEVEQAFLRAKSLWEQEKLKMTGEMVKLRRVAQILGRPVPRTGVREASPEVRELQNQLKANLAEWSAERERLVAQIHNLEQSARQWDVERRQLNDHAGQLQQAFMKAQEKIRHYELTAREPSVSEVHIETLRKEKEALQRELHEARITWEAERTHLNSGIERLEQQLQRMSDTGERVSKEVVDQLRLQYEQKLQEAIEQKTELAKNLQSASTLLETERGRLSAAQKGGSDSDKEAIEAEVSRVENLLNEIVATIDNPATALPIVIRKNVEKAELDAYLKGVLFALSKK